MQQSVCNVSLLVDDYDKGIEFYTKTLSFTLLDDIENGPDSVSYTHLRAHET